MEQLAARIRDLVASQPPHDLLGYIYSQLTLAALFGEKKADSKHDDSNAGFGSQTEGIQFVLEYVHAVLASTQPQETTKLDEAACAELFECADKLRTLSMLHAMMTSAGSDDGYFGPDTADVEFRAKSNWIILRGNRHQVLEGEFYAFALEPHDEILRATYGMSAIDIAAGFQAIADSTRTGHMDAFTEIERQMKSAQTFAKDAGQMTAESMQQWAEEHPGEMKTAAFAIDDVFRGGILNLSRHTNLPAALLDDLAYQRGEETEFYADAPYSGTPFRTLPARKKPLIKLGDEYYATDLAFIRDAGYRALLFNLLQRRPDYKTEFLSRQKEMSEAAFFRIFDSQFEGARIDQEVWYRDPSTKQWVENDTLIRLDDALFLVEAKAGAAATIASPATDFDRHVRSIQNLVIDAYSQCERFFNYLASADEVPIYRRENNRYVESDRVCLADYRVVFPMGLTVESFSPFSTMCKELPDVTPLLGKHPFISLSIDDLFVLKRFLPTPGELTHYFEVRQSVGGMKGVQLFDEFDHLGAYILKNRFDLDLEEQQKQNNPTFVMWDGMDEAINEHFSHPDWSTRPVPKQDFPPELASLLTALDRTRLPNWLMAESQLRNYGDEGRNNVASMLFQCRQSLKEHDRRCFLFDGDPCLFVWLQKSSALLDRSALEEKAKAAGIASNSKSLVGIIAFFDANLDYESAKFFSVRIPTTRSIANAKLFEDAESMRGRHQSVSSVAQKKRKLGRNDPCWCGSGIKFKKCHGR